MKNLNKLLASSALLSMLAPGIVQAAEKVVLTGNNQLIKSISSQTRSLSMEPSSLLGLEQASSLQVKNVYRDNDGKETIRYQQTYHGLPVIGGDVIFSKESNGVLRFAHGLMLRSIGNDVKSVTPRLTAKQALRIASSQSNSLTSQGVSQRENELNRLAIWSDQNHIAKLVYEVSYVVHGNVPSRPYFIIDALNGRVLYQFDNIQTADATGPGGNQKTGKWEYGTDYGYMDVTQQGSTCIMENQNVRTVDLKNRTSGGSTHSFECGRNTYKEVNGGYSPLNDAHYFGSVVFDMYGEWLNTAPLSFQLVMRAHYGNGVDNAYWDGSTMSFGDGATQFYPLTSVDVSAHEVSHGFTEQNSGLVYSGMSGGLNEAFSDISGEAAEYYMTGTNDFLVGATITKSSEALRFMDDPTKDGKSVGHTSDYYSGMDVHHSSGIYNRAFYNLATTNGWDTKKAFLIFARANQRYWSSNATFNSAGVGVLDAACDLGYSVEDVQSALSLVGVNAQPSSDDCEIDPTDPIDPKADFSFSINDVYTVSFADKSKPGQDKDGNELAIKEWYWDFGDRNSSNEVNPAHTYSEVGTYNVSLTITDSAGNTDTIYQEVAITQEPAEDEIKDGESKNIDLAKGEWKYFYFENNDPQITQLKFSTTGGSGDADLYVRLSEEPNLNEFDCRSYTSSNNETCTLNSLQQGRYYVGVYAYSNVSGLTLSLEARVDDNNGGCDGLPTWNASTYYYTGDRVSHEGIEYKALWWNSNANPADNHGTGWFDKWEKIGNCQ